MSLPGRRVTDAWSRATAAFAPYWTAQLDYLLKTNFTHYQTMLENLMNTFQARGVAIDGLIKMKLAHAAGFSVLIPDILVAQFQGEWKWFQPKFFTACLLGFLDGQAYGLLSVEPSEDLRLLVRMTQAGFVRRFDDGSQLYRCKIDGSRNLGDHCTGTCSVSDDFGISLDLFHHTLPDTVRAIQESGHFRPSAWNIQGTRELSNVGYAYFTSLPEIRSDRDLQAIAMASDGRIAFLPTNATSRREAVVIEVYRQNTMNRRASIGVKIPAEIIAPQHIYRHAPAGSLVYYECCHPEITRVGLKPGHVIAFDGTQLNVGGDELKRFDYVVLGDADTREGLIAPYDEENTASTFLFERCPDQTFFEFWRKHSNSDQVTGKTIERLIFR